MYAHAMVHVCMQEGADLYKYRVRIIFLNKPVDDETGNQIVATMLYLDSVNKSDLNFYINCAGGDVWWALPMSRTADKSL